MNNKLRAGIVDDEQDGREFIALLLTNEFPEINIVFKAESIDQAEEEIKKQVPDILFLDIQLGQGDAFVLLERTGKLASQIIFITAYDYYAIKAIRNNAVDYVLKPIQKGEFISAVQRAIKNFDAKSFKKEMATRINLPSLHGFKSVAISEIIRCEADSNYTMIYFSDKSKVMISRTLQEFETQLLPHGFYRIHHKHLINLAYFKEYVKGSGGQVILSDGSAVDVSVRRKNDFLDQIKRRN